MSLGDIKDKFLLHEVELQLHMANTAKEQVTHFLITHGSLPVGLMVSGYFYTSVYLKPKCIYGYVTSSEQTGSVLRHGGQEGTL